MTDPIVELEAVARRPSAGRAVSAARDVLDMDVAYATRIVDGSQLFQTLRGDGASFGVGEGTKLPLGETYCSEILAGRLPPALPDVRAHPRSAAMAVTAASGVGAFVSVPLRLANGRLYGTLCAADHAARSGIGERELQYLRILARTVADDVERHMLREEIDRLQAREASIETLMVAVEARDSYTGDHSRAVVRNARAVAGKLGLSEAAIADVEKVALLHDVGKLAIPDSILRKEGPLSPEEWNLMHEHPAAGARIVSAIDGLAHLAPAIAAEHERWDGRGYPRGLAGEEIPLAARIAFVCDAYDAITSDRPYRQARPHEVAIAQLIAHAGTQFCPNCVSALVEVFEGRRDAVAYG